MAEQSHTIFSLTETFTYRADFPLHGIEQALTAIDVIVGAILNRSDEVKGLAQAIFPILEDARNDLTDLRKMIEGNKTAA